MKFLENTVFGLRIVILALFAAVTVFSLYYAVQMRLDAGFYKQLPQGHPYIETFLEYQDRLFGANRIIVVLNNADGDIWNKEFLAQLKGVTDDIFFLPGIDRRTVTSMWTPNTRILEITEEGITARDLIPGRFTPETITPEAIRQLQNDVIKGGFTGRLVSTDFTASLIVAELLEYYTAEDPQTGVRRQVKLDYFDLAEKLETQIRGKYETGPYKIHILGFAKMIGDIADGARTVVFFFIVAFILTTLSVYFYSQSWVLTFVALSCSLTSLIWQFGLLKLLGFGLDPLAILVPFLVFAIGVSHGVQQLNLFTRELANGATAEQASRGAFTGLLIPGSMALTTDMAGFATLYLIPIQMIQELAITASIGIALKILTNIIMLPLLLSYCGPFFNERFIERVRGARAFRKRIMRVLGLVAYPVPAFIIFLGGIALFVVAYTNSLGRHIGDLHPGAPELRERARYNVDARIVTHKFTIGLDLLTIVIETPPQACIQYPYMNKINEFSWYMQNVPGVRSVQSVAFQAKQISSGWNEGNLKWRALPRNTFSLVQSTGPIPSSSGLLDTDCTLLPVQVFTRDSKAETIKKVVAAAEEWIKNNSWPSALSVGEQLMARKIWLPRMAGVGTPPTKVFWPVNRDQVGQLQATLATREGAAAPAGPVEVAFTVVGYNWERPWGQASVTETIRLTFDSPNQARFFDMKALLERPDWELIRSFQIQPQDTPSGTFVEPSVAGVAQPAYYNAPGDGKADWLVSRADVSELTFQTPPLIEGPVNLKFIAFPGDVPAGVPSATHDVTLQAGEVGKPIAIDLGEQFQKPEWANAKLVMVQGVPDSAQIRLGSGNVGVGAAVNHEIEVAEFPMMLIVYVVIAALTFLTYWDWRAVVVCCVPLTVGTFLGYWFMKEIEIGLKVSTLPVMVLAVGIGVDYAYYIYNRVQFHLSKAHNITISYQKAMFETGMAVVFVALTFSIGVATWSFSDLKFQADMGMLLTFMFMVNLFMAITLLPAIAVVLDTLIPRRKLPKAPPGEGEEAEF